MSLKEDIKRPFNFLTLLLAILGIGLAIYFYNYPPHEKALAYTWNRPTLIFDSKLSSPRVRLVDAAGSPVTANTYLMSYILWNIGSVPIEPSDIRLPVRFWFDGAERILDYKITDAVGQEVSGFSLSATNGTDKYVQLDWNHFDPEKAVKIQIIFSQTNVPEPRMTSDIVGVVKVESLLAEKKMKWARLFNLSGLIWLLVGSYVGSRLIYRGIKRRNSYGFIFIGVIMILIVVFSAPTFWKWTFSPTPPF